MTTAKITASLLSTTLPSATSTPDDLAYIDDARIRLTRAFLRGSIFTPTDPAGMEG